EALRALFDRFALRVRCDAVPQERLADLLAAGWRLEQTPTDGDATLALADIRQLQAAITAVDLSPALPAYLDLVKALRGAGVALTDRRAIKLQRVIAASALLAGRDAAAVSDLWVLRHVWDGEEQIESVTGIVDAALAPAENDPQAHPRAFADRRPNSAGLARELDSLAEQANQTAAGQGSAPAQSLLRDRLAALAARVPWVANETERAALESRVAALRDSLAEAE
ncbi:MAG TPA: ATPase, partial [Planctomycetia bacterium]|nr:ATPase [Planctomycetia bacterium]